MEQALNDKKRLATSGANFARAYTVEFGTCQFPYNFTGCQDLAKQKVRRWLISLDLFIYYSVFLLFNFQIRMILFPLCLSLFFLNFEFGLFGGCRKCHSFLKIWSWSVKGRISTSVVLMCSGNGEARKSNQSGDVSNTIN